MLRNKKFAKYVIAFNILGIIFNFMYSGLQNDQINIIQASSVWTNTATLMPLTVGNLVCILLTFVYGTLFIKIGVKKTLIPCILISAIGCLGIAGANGIATLSGVALNSANPGDPAVTGSYALYAVSLFLVRCTCMCMQLSGFMLASNWFIKYRGRVMGIITLGSPLFSIIGTSVMTTFIATHLKGDYRPFYVGICVVLVLIAIMVGTLLKDTPEDAGLYPDGADHPPVSEAGQDKEVHMTVKEVLSQSKAWWLILSFGIFQFIINACMASMVSWYTWLVVANADTVAAGPMGAMFEGMGGLAGSGAMVLFVGQATKWLSVGALLGIPMSYLFGVLDDKIGSVKASIILGVTELIPIFGLMYQNFAVKETGALSVPILVLWGFGVACMTGGVPTMHPSLMASAYGRLEYQSANRIIMAIQLIPAAFAAVISAYFINSGKGVQYWIVMMILVVIGICSLLPLLKVKDANAEERLGK
jgi:MFS transporter, OFA family, oxalate/formate antiporter